MSVRQFRICVFILKKSCMNVNLIVCIFVTLGRRKIGEDYELKIICLHFIETEILVKNDSSKSCLIIYFGKSFDKKVP